MCLILEPVVTTGYSISSKIKPSTKMRLISGTLDKLGSFGSIISAMGCAACFPTLGALGASVGLGFLSSYEGLLINKLLPAFAVIALLANVWGWSRHRVHYRGLLSVSGPIAIILTLYPLWKYGWSTYLFYVGLILMLAVSIFDVVKPAQSQCTIT